MAMVVDKARRDDPPLSVDRALGGAAQLPELDDLAVLDPDIAAESRASRAVDNAAVSDQQVIRHGDFLSSSVRVSGEL
jgi:hypothetical protein